MGAMTVLTFGRRLFAELPFILNVPEGEYSVSVGGDVVTLQICHERGALGLVAFGIVCVATRRLTVAQIAGLLLVENGVALAALGVPHGTSLVIELGVALDVVMISLVAVAYHARIVEEFGSGDAGELRSLRD